jgi:hypothetical protein
VLRFGRAERRKSFGLKSSNEGAHDEMWKYRKSVGEHATYQGNLAKFGWQATTTVGFCIALLKMECHTFTCASFSEVWCDRETCHLKSIHHTLHCTGCIALESRVCRTTSASFDRSIGAIAEGRRSFVAAYITVTYTSSRPMHSEEHRPILGSVYAAPARSPNSCQAFPRKSTA